jgi:hypothetical protein
MNDAKTFQTARLETPTDLKSNAVHDISGALTILLADMLALYVKTKNFHWHVSGPHFRDYHLLMDEQASQIFATTDEIAERVRKIGGTTLRSIGHISRLQRILDNNADFVMQQGCGLPGIPVLNHRRMRTPLAARKYQSGCAGRSRLDTLRHVRSATERS